MLSTEDLETLIAMKKHEIEKEKSLLGIRDIPNITNTEEDKENDQEIQQKPKKQVNFKEHQTESSQERILCERQQNESTKEASERELYDLEEKIPPDLERYIRRYIGIPAMLKAGEYSPNNPLLRAELNTERGTGDAFLGLGEYERRRNTLRKIRQAQYRQYLDQQAKKKQEAKEQAERERREREEKERLREERERQLLLERERYSPERRRASVCTVPVSNALVQTTKVDTGVQVDGLSSPLSVAVQTDDAELYRVPLRVSPAQCLTEAERELSPRTVAGGRLEWDAAGRRRSYGDFDERTCAVKKCNRDKLISDLRHSYMPSIFDADAIHMRNLQAEKEAAARRQFYQQELKNQILEQQRIREERKSREKMLEQAEMRRLEEQLRMLRVAQEREVDKQHDISTAMKDNAKEYDAKRTELQREIDLEQKKLLRATSTTIRHVTPNATTRHNTSKSDSPRSKLPFYYSNKTFQPIDNEDKKPYSFNIPDNSIFSANYDVDTYLRKNLNFRDKIDLDIENIGNNPSSASSVNNNKKEKNVVIEKALIHEPKEKQSRELNKRNSEKQEFIEEQELNRTDKQTNYFLERQELYKKNKDKQEHISENQDFNKRNKEKQDFLSEMREYKESSYNDIDNISIPVLRHSPKTKQNTKECNTNLSDAMKKVDDKWKVPAVQKNILKSLPNEDGKSVNILTQLGSIRRQLQLEQLKLDKMLSVDGS